MKNLPAEEQLNGAHVAVSQDGPLNSNIVLNSAAPTSDAKCIPYPEVWNHTEKYAAP
jgi:hypothetical protein